MNTFYTTERNAQILISLLKAHGIRKIVASPGTTNICFVASVQQDSWFEIYSSVDERSAAYIACGLAVESGEPVALSCTGATASRNYPPGLTEAFYRKIPVIAITSTQHIGRVGHNIAQVIDRSSPMNDIAKLSIQIPTIHNIDDEWAYNVKINEAILELKHNGCGPVHIDLTTEYSLDFDVKELPPVQVINRFNLYDELPDIKAKSIGVFVGAHTEWSTELTETVDAFCEAYNGVVFCDNTSNYKGKYEVHPSLICAQSKYISNCRNMDLMIHIGDISGAEMNLKPQKVWRVNSDGAIRDTFRKLRYVFEMTELNFFKSYIINGEKEKKTGYYEDWKKEYDSILKSIPELPFSNLWVAQNTVNKIPQGCSIHLGILNSLRSWNFFELPKSVLGYSNTGGFGIDGLVSTLVGASLAKTDKLFFGIVGDLAFFYDMNSIGNRHIGKNIRLMVINNGRGVEFRNYHHNAAKFGEDADSYMAAAGHYGNKSAELLKHYATDLGFEYLCASNKDEYLAKVGRFTTAEILGKSILFEIFTDMKDESNALYAVHNIAVSTEGVARQMVKNVLGEKGVKTLKNIIGK